VSDGAAACATEPSVPGTLTDLLAGLVGLDWASGQDLELREGGGPVGRHRGPFDETARAWKRALDEALAPALRLDLVRVDLTVDAESGTCELTVQAGGRCGFCVVGAPGDPVFVSVRPKVEDVDFLGLGALAGWLPGAMRLGEELTSGARRTPSLLSLLVARYHQALDDLFQKGGLRRRHETVDETLVARRRGQLRLPAWQREVAHGRLLHFPCRHAVHELDNLPNRALLWALELLLRLGQATHDETTRGQLARLRVLEARFAGVPRREVRSGALARLTRLPRSFDHYRSTAALPIARWIIDHVHPSDRAGGVAGLGFAVSMDRLFEAAFARVVERGFAGCGVETQAAWSFRIAQREARGATPKMFYPDVFVPGDERAGYRPLVLDTKWKDAVPVVAVPEPAADGEREGVVLEEGGLRVKNVDLFQIAAYAYLAGLRDRGGKAPVATRGVLVYPIGAGTNPGRFDVTWAHVSAATPQAVSLHVLPWYVGPGLAGRTGELLHALRELRRGNDEPIAPGPAAPDLLPARP
jgi:hypothetical protein